MFDPSEEAQEIVSNLAEAEVEGECDVHGVCDLVMVGACEMCCPECLIEALHGWLIELDGKFNETAKKLEGQPVEFKCKTCGEPVIVKQVECGNCAAKGGGPTY